MYRKLLAIIFFTLIFYSCNKENDKFFRNDPVPARTFLIPSLQWNLSSTPLSFPESSVLNDLAYGYNRAQISWYNIDPIFQTQNSLVPSSITPSVMSHDFVRMVYEHEIYWDKNIPSGTPIPLTTLNIDFYPSEIGPYNYDTEPTVYSSGIDATAKLNNPETRWGGITQVFNYIDHDMNYVEFWLMDPFIDDEHIAGDLYINIGSFSEDILSDNIHQNESSISSDSTNNNLNCWGKHGKTNQWSYSFENVDCQDFGLDGLSSSQEKAYFTDYLNKVSEICTPAAITQILNDPGKDDYHYYRGSDYDNLATPIRARYAHYNDLEGNSTANFPNVEPYPTTNSMLPDKEDQDNSESLDVGNTYYEYHIELDQNSFVSGTNFIDSVWYAQGVFTIDNSAHSLYWYHFKIPIQDYTSAYGNVQTLSDLKMIRLYLTNFSTPVTLRLAEFYITE